GDGVVEHQAMMVTAWSGEDWMGALLDGSGDDDGGEAEEAGEDLHGGEGCLMIDEGGVDGKTADEIGVWMAENLGMGERIERT
ncbi:MAG: hypothetical protein Q9203_007409, partial [Teloschistes exilis]